eukprot:CAMPEP_0179305478 /NCGR_PEP_ID=MMETSP0797-20121207/49634_1 /TAXON_ID=47934 /ORGANISM="Dinophysis acuminata, Strain DAEP01" /LENGTH=131 /DNA_ID=CAMNT_0021015107 /DNA_START=43 /DNA_END=439 /DNA_ORIENTATION=-
MPSHTWSGLREHPGLDGDAVQMTPLRPGAAQGGSAEGCAWRPSEEPALVKEPFLLVGGKVLPELVLGDVLVPVVLPLVHAEAGVVLSRVKEELRASDRVEDREARRCPERVRVGRQLRALRADRADRRHHL